MKTEKLEIRLKDPTAEQVKKSLLHCFGISAITITNPSTLIVCFNTCKLLPKTLIKRIGKQQGGSHRKRRANILSLKYLQNA